MSTAVVVAKNDRIVIGADTMTKYGSQYESADLVSSHSKILQVGSSYIATLGHAAFDLVLEDYFSSLESPPALDSPLSIFKTSVALHGALKENYFLNREIDDDTAFDSSRLDCLIANASGIYSLGSRRTVLSYSKYYALGAGAEYALGALHAIYETVADPEAIARAGLEAAAAFNDATGAPFEIHTIER